MKAHEIGRIRAFIENTPESDPRRAEVEAQVIELAERRMDEGGINVLRFMLGFNRAAGVNLALSALVETGA